MKRLFAVALFAIFVLSSVALPVFAAGDVTDAGNKLCPISGEPVSGTSFVEYQGKRYGLCCPGCDKIFLSDPAKYLAKMNTQEAAEKAPASGAPAVSDAAASKEMQRDMEQGDL